jgi:hypothetical protein
MHIARNDSGYLVNFILILYQWMYIRFDMKIVYLYICTLGFFKWSVRMGTFFP